MRSEAFKARFLETVALRDAGRLDASFERLQSLRADMVRAEDAGLLGQVLVLIGNHHGANRRFEDALEAYEAALPKIVEGNRPIALAELKWSIGDTYRVQGACSKALDSYRAAQRDLGSLGLKPRAAGVALAIAESCSPSTAPAKPSGRSCRRFRRSKSRRWCRKALRLSPCFASRSSSARPTRTPSASFANTSRNRTRHAPLARVVRRAHPPAHLPASPLAATRPPAPVSQLHRPGRRRPAPQPRRPRLVPLIGVRSMLYIWRRPLPYSYPPSATVGTTSQALPSPSSSPPRPAGSVSGAVRQAAPER